MLCSRMLHAPEQEVGGGERRGVGYTRNLCLRFACALHCNSSAIRAEALDMNPFEQVPVFSLPGINPFQFLEYYRCIKSVHVSRVVCQRFLIVRLVDRPIRQLFMVERPKTIYHICPVWSACSSHSHSVSVSPSICIMFHVNILCVCVCV